jgi:hypothetical protein
MNCKGSERSLPWYDLRYHYGSYEEELRIWGKGSDKAVCHLAEFSTRNTHVHSINATQWFSYVLSYKHGADLFVCCAGISSRELCVPKWVKDIVNLSEVQTVYSAKLTAWVRMYTCRRSNCCLSENFSRFSFNFLMREALNVSLQFLATVSSDFQLN